MKGELHVSNLDIRRSPITDSKTIPILYFPKTRPSDPPLAAIPKPLSERELHFSSPNVYISEHVDTCPLAPYWDPSSSHAKRPSTGLEQFKKSVFVGLLAQFCSSLQSIDFFYHSSPFRPRNPLLLGNPYPSSSASCFPIVQLKQPCIPKTSGLN